MHGARFFRHRGLRVACQRHPGALTAIALSVRAGARFDGRHPGIAHMAEHMLFQGTATLDQLALNRRAAELGGEHNADTGYETISLTFEVFNEDLDDALGLLAEQFYRSEVSPERFRKERRVVIDEIRGRSDDPFERLHARAWGLFFRGALAHPVCGTIGDVRAMEARHVAAFIRRHFTHAASVLAVVGGADERAVRAAVRRHFRHGDAAAPAPAPPVRYGRTGLCRWRRGGQAYIVSMMAVPPVPRELLAVGLAVDIVGADPDSRLFQEIRERLGLGYDVSATIEAGAGWAVATIMASAAPSAAERLRQAVQDTCARAAAEGFQPEELLRARKKLRYRYASLSESRLDRALALAEGTLTGFPPPEAAERIVARLSQAEIEAAWRRVVAGRTLTALTGA